MSYEWSVLQEEDERPRLPLTRRSVSKCRRSIVVLFWHPAMTSKVHHVLPILGETRRVLSALTSSSCCSSHQPVWPALHLEEDRWFPDRCRASLTWCALCAPSPRRSSPPTSAPAPTRRSETHTETVGRIHTHAHTHTQVFTTVSVHLQEVDSTSKSGSVSQSSPSAATFRLTLWPTADFHIWGRVKLWLIIVYS